MVSPIVVAHKKGTDDIRMCIDLSHLNWYVKRERYQSATPAQMVADIKAEKAQVFTKLDVKRLPPVHTSQRESRPHHVHYPIWTVQVPPCTLWHLVDIGTHYNHRMDEAFAGLSGFRVVVNDVAIYDQDVEHSTTHTSGNSYSDAPRETLPLV